VSAKTARVVLALLLALSGCGGGAASNGPASPPPAQAKGVYLADLTWPRAEPLLGPDAVVVIPLGAGSKEHGMHLLLSNDQKLADYFAARVVEQAAVVVAPTMTYHYFPAFGEYPGSTSLRLETARDLTVDVVRSLARHGPRRFYVLNTGVSTVKALEPAAAELAKEHVLLRYTDLIAAIGPVEKEVAQQEGGTHADEIETSMMLYIAPDACDMTKASKDYHPNGGALTRRQGAEGTYSPTGAWGDPTLATRAKGRRIVEALVAALLRDVDELRRAPLP
jgi:creatinine amidohydrolase